MPIDIDNHECIEEPKNCVIIANVRYGDIITTDVQTKVCNIKIQYAEFIQSFYLLGEFIYNPKRFRMEDALLREYRKTHPLSCELQTMFYREVRMLTVQSTTIALLDSLDGSFYAAIPVSIWSSALNYGLKFNIRFEVNYCPRKLNSGHIYQIIQNQDQEQVHECNNEHVIDCDEEEEVVECNNGIDNECDYDDECSEL